MPGRNVAIHCMDVPMQKGKHGFIGLFDFPGEIIRLFQKYGFIQHSRVTIWKDPVVEMQRTKALGLLHKQVKKDSVMSRQGLPDYVIVMRNVGENETQIKCDIDVNTWQKYASPVWHDINYGDTLNRSGAKEDKDEKHLTPLQLQTIHRCIKLWSNHGEIVFDPFMGIGSTGYEAIKLDRKALGIELKESYFDMALKYLLNAEKENSQSGLFA